MRRVPAVRYRLGDLASNYQTSFHVRGRTCQEVAALVSTASFREIEAIYKRERAGDGGGGRGGHVFGTPTFARTRAGQAAGQSHPQHSSKITNKAGLTGLLETSSSSSSSSPSGAAVPAPDPGRACFPGAPEATSVMQVTLAGSARLPPGGNAPIRVLGAPAPTCNAQASILSLVDTNLDAGQGLLPEDRVAKQRLSPLCREG
ncbi:hypothetical protein MTO96_042617 [Rhipicephalus appendiculatus]